jgi:hypothetical protein
MQAAGAVQVTAAGATVATLTSVRAGAGVVVAVATATVLTGWSAEPEAADAAAGTSRRRMRKMASCFMIDPWRQAI